MNRPLWDAMLEDLYERLQPTDVLVSGGAARADHLAVVAYLQGWVAGLKLFLPDPLRMDVDGPAFLETTRGRCSGSAANFYHRRFDDTTGVASLEQLANVRQRGAHVHEQPAIAGFGGMFARNRLVAQHAAEAVAYTWGQEAPTDGGTADTWRAMAHVPRVHVSLLELLAHGPTSEPLPRADAPGC